MASPESPITPEEWDALAPTSAKMLTSGPSVASAQHMAVHADALLPFSQATTILDLGCGAGQVTQAVLSAHHGALPASARVLGADTAPGMRAQYAQTRAAAIARGGVFWRRAAADAVDLDARDCAALADGAVSHLLANLVLAAVPDPGRAVAAMRRVVAPGGVVAVSALREAEWARLATYPAKVRPDLAVDSPTHGCWSAGEVARQLRGAGFRDVEVVEVESHLAFGDYGAICRFLLTKSPQSARVLPRMTEEEIGRTHELMVADLTSWHPVLPAKMVGKVEIAYCRK
ncbi:S-adenosyl-L-methionine-dependent methyltransferase [Xylariomycetidae sp. FL0641]|nr:S-adenosyl-L-methionine-dependent methyltransferase [Xylariomycetidae sp. FL0641]